ncbi:Calcineurin-like phosphoesterase superfamily domain protein [Rubripirellula obstinata]|uniref:Calcineurin-like phosphoesterase superfamily domain protein n=1 Tax=Rubripirellula obstinata TaxID=406547 RepID=A0A5B1CFB0_9BACT|nr:metallophosphoesterase [Rubripirellula obstinata]KAA1259226.1 Calcineurin-like phosphoesterase superfamily domain protein [Rubripirellula obstinata]
MKILCFSDLHRDRDAAMRLVNIAEDVDVVIGAGDFANRHQGATDTLEILSQINLPAVLVPGNGETVEELRLAAATWSTATILHGEGCVVGGVNFWGVGGGIPVTPFGDWSYDFSEEEAVPMLTGTPTGGVLVVHSPPIDTVDHDSKGLIRGSQAIRDAVESKKPQLVVCGHIHSDWGKKIKLGPTSILNAGPQGMIVEIDDSNSTEAS